MTVFTPAKPTNVPLPPAAPTSPARSPAFGVGHDGAHAEPPRFWAAWTTLTVFIFIGFECILLAAALKGSWFILLAPGLVCAVKAFDSWKVLRRAADA
jgi:hypothetical protein